MFFFNRKKLKQRDCIHFFEPIGEASFHFDGGFFNFIHVFCIHCDKRKLFRMPRWERELNRQNILKENNLDSPPLTFIGESPSDYKEEQKQIELLVDEPPINIVNESRFSGVNRRMHIFETRDTILERQRLEKRREITRKKHFILLVKPKEKLLFRQELFLPSTPYIIYNLCNEGVCYLKGSKHLHLLSEEEVNSLKYFLETKEKTSSEILTYFDLF